MSGPSCVNARDWAFGGDRPGDAAENGPGQRRTRPAPGPGRRRDPGVRETWSGLSRAKDYWIIDRAIAAQEHRPGGPGLGVGSVWLGTWPQMNRVEAGGRCSPAGDGDPPTLSSPWATRQRTSQPPGEPLRRRPGAFRPLVSGKNKNNTMAAAGRGLPGKKVCAFGAHTLCFCGRP